MGDFAKYKGFRCLSGHTGSLRSLACRANSRNGKGLRYRNMPRIMNLYVPVFLYLSIVTNRLNFRRLLRVVHFTSSVTSEFTDPYTRKKYSIKVQYSPLLRSGMTFFINNVIEKLIERNFTNCND